MNRTYAIIPARSGSRGIPNKNIRVVGGMELMAYSIKFALKLNVDRVICSTDSNQYAEIARHHGAEVPFLRSANAASDTAMEEDIIEDLVSKFTQHDIIIPDILVWLRPTFVFRDKNKVTKCIQRLKEDNNLTACRTVCGSEGRLYYPDQNDYLQPNFDDQGRSMMRRQGFKPLYKVFSTDVFRLNPNSTSVDFLGRRIGFEVVDKICGLDIDDNFDLELVDLLLTHRKNLVSEYLP